MNYVLAVLFFVLAALSFFTPVLAGDLGRFLILLPLTVAFTWLGVVFNRRHYRNRQR